MASIFPVSQRVGIIDAAKLVDDAARLLDVDKFDRLLLAAALSRLVDAAGMLAESLRDSDAPDSRKSNPTNSRFFVSRVGDGFPSPLVGCRYSLGSADDDGGLWLVMDTEANVVVARCARPVGQIGDVVFDHLRRLVANANAGALLASPEPVEAPQ